MKYSIQRTGGFAGRQETVASLDTAHCSPAQAAQLQQAWTALRARIRAAAQAPSVGADFLKYEIVTQDESGEQRLAWLDDGNEVVPELLAFISQVTSAGGPA